MATEKGPIIARGRTAEIFAWGSNRVLKLFLDWCPAAWAEQEARVTQAVHETGIPVPAVEGIVEVESRLGIVFERVEGPSMLGVLGAKPWKLVQFARLLAELQAAMHSREIAGFPLQRERLESNIQAAEVLPATTREAVLNLLRRLPDGNAVCHGDFHPDNIIMSSRGPIIIDWLTATQGNPLADVAKDLAAPAGRCAAWRRSCLTAPVQPGWRPTLLNLLEAVSATPPRLWSADRRLETTGGGGALERKYPGRERPLAGIHRSRSPTEEELRGYAVPLTRRLACSSQPKV